MLIENAEALRLWLTGALSPPICDADPGALAKYVLALLKKDKPESDLKEFCIEQLDVFLQKETKGFVERLFSAINDKSYLIQPAPAVIPSTQNVQEQTQKFTSSPSKLLPVEQPSTKRSQKDRVVAPASTTTTINNNAIKPNKASRDENYREKIADDRKEGVLSPRNLITTESGFEAKSDSKEVAKGSARDRIRLPKRPTSPGHAGQPTFKTARRSRSPRQQQSQQQRLVVRRHSPIQAPSATAPSSSIQSTVRPGYGSLRAENKDKDKVGGTSRRSASPASRRHFHRYHGSRKLETRSRSRSRSKRRSASRGRDRHRSREKSPSGREPLYKRHRSLSSSSGYSLSSNSDSGGKERRRKKERCKDYDEKGYCMKGDACSYDHGPDPVVVDDVSLPTIMTIKGPVAAGVLGTLPPAVVDFSQPPPGYPLASAVPPPPGVDILTTGVSNIASDVNKTASGMGARLQSSVQVTTTATAGPAVLAEAYNPEAPSLASTQAALWAGGHLAAAYASGYPVPGQPLQILPKVPGVGFRGRDLIALGGDPTMAIQEHGALPTDGLLQQQAPVRAPFQGRGAFRGGWRGGRGRPFARQPFDASNCSLEVKKIPIGLNSITKLNDHFGQFGEIVNIQIHYGGDPEAALVTFANKFQATGAYKSTVPIFNNRFIRMFWHKPGELTEDQQTAVADQAIGQKSVYERLGPVPKLHEAGESDQKSVLLSSTGNLTTTLYNPAALKNAAAKVTTKMQLPQKSFAVQQVASEHPKTHPGKKADAQKKYMDIQKAKIDLFNKAIEQQKLLLQRLEKCKETSKKKKLAEMIKEIDAKVKKLKEELDAMKPAVSKSSKNKEQVERQLLDAEMDMMNQQKAGTDTPDLYQRLTELRNEVILLNEMKSGKAPEASAPNGSHNHGQPAVRRAFNRHIPAHANLDKRPKEVLISNWQGSLSADDQSSSSQVDGRDLVAQLSQFSLVEDWEYWPRSTSTTSSTTCVEHDKKILVAFKTRRDAELAIGQCKEFNGNQLDFQWYSRRNHLPSEKDEPEHELTAQELLATLNDGDEQSSDESQNDGGDEDDVPDIERNWKH